MDYEKDIKIDEDSLDLEWLDQPALFMKYARHLAQARRTQDEAKQEIDVVSADIDRQIREKPEDFDIVKVTEGAIKSALLTEPDYQIAYKKYLDAKYEADMASNAVQAFNQRKDALENLVRLHGQQYFAGPRLPRDLSDERKKQEKKVDSGIASKIKRTK